MFQKTLEDVSLDAWRLIDVDFDETVKPLEAALLNYKNLDWNFLEEYLVTLYIHIGMCEGRGNAVDATKFIRYGNANLNDVTPYWIMEKTNKGVDVSDPKTYPPKVDADYFEVTNPGIGSETIIRPVLFYGKRDKAIKELKTTAVEQAESARLFARNEAIVKEKMFSSVFGTDLPPPEDFDAYKIMFEDLHYLVFMKFIGNQRLLTKIVYPRP